MTDPIRALCAELAAELDHNRRCLLDDATLTHPLADRARYLLAEPADAPAAAARAPGRGGGAVIRITCEGGRIGNLFWVNSDPATIRDCAGFRCILWGAVGWDTVLIDLEVEP